MSEPTGFEDPPGPSRIVGELADRLGAGPVAVVGVVVAALAAAVGAWWAFAGPSPPPAEATVPLASASPTIAEVTTTTESTVVVVHVDGAVADPGVHELTAGARVVDAVAAGGLTSAAQPGGVNLAQVVVDGERIWVPAVGEDPPPVLATAPGAATAADPTPVSINTADAAGLDALPGVGPAIAAAIVENRERDGPFGSVDELVRVPGIGSAKLDQLRPFATL